MDRRIRELERRILSEGDLDAAKQLLQIRYRLSVPASGPGPGHLYPLGVISDLRVALNYVGNLLLPDFVDRLNEELAKTGIPFNPIGIASTDEIDNAYTPPFWWASLKEKYSLEPEITISGRPVCSPEERGQVPGFQRSYGIDFEYVLHPNGRITLLVGDTFTGHKVDKWLGRGDQEEVYQLSQQLGYYGGELPESWVSQAEFNRRRQELRQRVVDAIYRIDPEIEVRFSRGQGFERGIHITPSQLTQLRENPAQLHQIDTFDPEKPYFYGDVCFDPWHGSGAVGNTRNINYMGFVAFIKPETFLQIATALPPAKERKTVSFFLEKLPTQEWCIAPPMLYLNVEDDACKAVGHEGRHRTLVLQNLGFDLIPVYIFPQYLRARNVDEELLEKMSLVLNEDGNDWVFFNPEYYVIDSKVYCPYRINDWVERKPVEIQTMEQKTPIPGEDRDFYYYWSKPLKENPYW